MFALGYALTFATVGVLPAGEPTTAQVRETVQRSIPYIQAKGASWIEEQKCVSCHQVNTMVWSLSAARRNSFQVSDNLDDWIKWATDTSLSKNDKGEVVGLGNKEGVAQLLLSLDSDADKCTVRKELTTLLADGQKPDGSWKPGGQLPSQKRPRSETVTVSTMWLALALMTEQASETNTPAVERALSFTEASPPGKSTEWYAVRLLLAVQLEDYELRDRLVKTIREHQQPDGGWGWLVAEDSDALGTGFAIYALLHAGVSSEDASIKRAQQFLINTQRADGSWAVNGTKAGRKDYVEETSVYWGTTWAALGLMAGLPDQSD